MKSAERRLRLMEIFSRQEFVSAEELCRKLGSSDSTIRRDLIDLESEGLVRRVHGGALSLTARDEGLDFRRRIAVEHDEKARIGAAAAAMVDDGRTLMLGGGSTVAEVARHLVARRLQVVTNSVPLAQIFWDSKTVEVTLTGGYLYPRTGAQIGPIAEQMLGGVTADILVLGVGGISADGLSDSNTLLVGTIRRMIDAARRVIVVADHTKFGQDAMVPVYPLDRVDTIVSGAQLPDTYRRIIESRAIRLVLA